MRDSGQGDHSHFAGAFLEVLIDNREILVGNSLLDRIKDLVMNNARQTPQYGEIPGTNDKHGDFLLIPV